MERDPRQQDNDPFADEEAELAGAEAAAIGGFAGDEDLDPAERPVREAGGGEQEGFEIAEDDLIEHASHGDERSASRPYYHAGRPEERGTADDGEAGDEFHSAYVEEGDEEARSTDD